MLDLSPTKILIILVVAVLLLGPKRLPQVARQLGAGWRRLRSLHSQLDSELRQNVPNLPSSTELVRLARSPLSALNRLADLHDGDGSTAEDDSGTEAEAGPEPVFLPTEPLVTTDDPNLN